MITTKRADMLELVQERHSHQIRNGTAATPYWKHCKSAADILEEAICQGVEDATVVENLYLAAMGHDLYEDGKPKVTADDIAAHYGHEVAALIAEVTNWKDDHDRDAYLNQLSHASDKAMLIKYADQIDNVESVAAHLDDLGPAEVRRLVRLFDENVVVLNSHEFQEEWIWAGNILRNRLDRTWPRLLDQVSTP